MSRPIQNPAFNNDWLITDTGEIDREFIKTSAEARAKSRYGADCSPSDIAFWEEKLTGMAEMLRDRHHGRVSSDTGRRLAVAALVGQCEAIAEKCALPEPVEQSLRLLIAKTLVAFEMPQKTDRQTEVA